MQNGADVTFIHIRRLTLVIVVGLGMAIMLYADPFPFWEYPFSYLVRTVSENGAANQPARRWPLPASNRRSGVV